MLVASPQVNYVQFRPYSLKYFERMRYPRIVPSLDRIIRRVKTESSARHAELSSGVSYQVPRNIFCTGNRHRRVFANESCTSVVKRQHRASRSFVESYVPRVVLSSRYENRA